MSTRDGLRRTGARRPRLVVPLLLFLSAQVHGQELSHEILSEAVQIVLRNNPVLKTQETLIGQSREIPDPRPGVSISGMSVDMGSRVWDPDAGSFDFAPAVGFGLSFAFRNPSRSLNTLTIQTQKTQIQQDYQRFKNQAIEELLSAVQEIARLDSEREGLRKLGDYLEDHGELMEKQVRAGVAQPDPDEILQLRERAIEIEVEIQTASAQIDSVGLKAALTLGGEEWEKLHDLLARMYGG